jgi:putative transposase
MDEARPRIGAYIRFYNEERPHSAHGIKTPQEVYNGKPTINQAV